MYRQKTSPENDVKTSCSFNSGDNQENKDEALVAHYQTAVAENGIHSQEADEAFNQIFNTYAHYAFLLARKQGISKETAEDLVQETFATIWKRLNGKENITNLPGLIRHSFQCRWKTYLEKTYHKKANGTAIQTTSLNSSVSTADTATQLTTRVSGAGRKEIALVGNSSHSPLQLNLLEQLYDPDENVEQTIIQTELWQQIRTLITHMPQNYRLALLQQLAGLELAEIAAKNGWSLDQTKKYVVRGRQWIVKHRHLFVEAAA